MTGPQTTAICTTIHQNWPTLALKSRALKSGKVDIEKAVRWGKQLKKFSFEAVSSVVDEWYATRKGPPELSELLRKAEAWRPAPHSWAKQFQHGDILCDPKDARMIGILDKEGGQVWREVHLHGRDDNRPYWAVLGSFRDMHNLPGAVTRLELCPPEGAAEQLVAWQSAYAADPEHWQFHVPVHLWAAAEARLKETSHGR